jgi:putative transposase
MRLVGVQHHNLAEITSMCIWLEVSASGYYEWRVRPESATARRRAWLAVLVRQAFDESDETYGHRRIHAQLRRWGQSCTAELVRGMPLPLPDHDKSGV